MTNKLLKENIIKHKEIIGIILFFSMISIVFILRFVRGNPFLHSEESYYHLNNIFNIIKGNAGYGFHLFLKSISKIIPTSGFFLVTPILGLLSILIFNKISKKFKIDSFTSLLFIIIFILSPSTIQAYSTLSTLPLVLFLLLLGTYLLTKKRISILAVPAFLFIPIIEPLSGILAIIIILIYIQFKEKSPELVETIRHLKTKSSSHLCVMATFIFTIIMIILSKTSWLGFKSFNSGILVNLISDLGANSGISIFIFILAIVGLTISGRRSKHQFTILSGTMILYVLNQNYIFFLSIILSYAAAIALTKLSDSKWKLREIKKLTLFLLILGILFSTMTFVDRVIEYPPQGEMVESLVWLNEYAKPESYNAHVVLSLPEDNYYVEYFSGYPSFDHTKINLNQLEMEQIDNNKIIQGQEIFALPYLHLLSPRFERQSAKYIYINPKVKEQLGEDSGLLFALRNEKFKLLYSSDEHEVWKIRKR
jgi:hypothetical protein